MKDYKQEGFLQVISDLKTEIVQLKQSCEKKDEEIKRLDKSNDNLLDSIQQKDEEIAETTSNRLVHNEIMEAKDKQIEELEASCELMRENAFIAGYKYRAEASGLTFDFASELHAKSHYVNYIYAKA